MYAKPSSTPSQTYDDAARQAVDRAVTALRQGGCVGITSSNGNGDSQVLAALSVENITDEAVARLEELARGKASLLITRRRATILGLASEGDGVVILSLAGGISAALAQSVANPALTDSREINFPAGLVVTPVEACPRNDILSFATQPGNVAMECAVVELARSARLLPAVLFVNVPATGATAELPVAGMAETVRAADILNHRRQALRQLKIVADAQVPLEGAENSRIVAFRPDDGGPEHLAIIIGAPEGSSPVLTRLHSECFTGDLLGSLRCDCGPQLRGAIAEISRQGGGVILYLAQEGRGIGLINKLRAYQIQDRGFDTVDANEMLGFEADERIYLPAAEMLRQLGFSRVRLLTNNPEKLRQLGQWGIEVTERVPHIFPANGHNAGYLRTKALRSGHMF